MSFQIVYNGLTIDNKQGIIIESMSGLSSAEIRTSEDYLTGIDGGAIWEQYYGMRNITITGSVVADTIEDYFTRKSELSNAFCKKDTDIDLFVTTWNGTTKRIPARIITMPDITEYSGEVTMCRWLVSLRCPSPFFTDQAASTGTIELSDIGGYPVGQWDTEEDEFVATSGMPVASPIPYSPDTLDINNTGDVATNPVYEISGPVTNPSIRNVTTNMAFTINTTVGATEKITVQLLNNVLDVRKNGVNMISHFTGNFPVLEKGVNTLRFTASTFQAGAKVDVSYFKNYLSL